MNSTIRYCTRLHSDISTFIKDYWFLIVAIAGIIGTWYSLKNAVNMHEKRITKLETFDEFIASKYNDLSLDIREIKTNLEYIKSFIENFNK